MRTEFIQDHLNGAADYQSVLDVPTNAAGIEHYIMNQERVRRWMVPDNHLNRLQLIGEGSFGEVQLGDFIGSTVAIKQSKDLTPQAYQDLIHEFLLHIEIRHPCICQLIGLSVTADGSVNRDGLPNIKASFILEYMAKGNLDSLVYDASRPLDFKFIIKSLHNVALGIAHLHYSQPQIIHADLKSENIFVDEYGVCKVGDLGGSVLLDSVNTHYKAPFSLIYASPKRIAAVVEKTKKIQLSFYDDVYSYGTMIYEMLTRTEPWQQISDMELVKAMIAGQADLTTQLPSRNVSQVTWLHGKFEDVPQSVVDTVAPQLLSLMSECGKFKEKERPDFKNLAQRMGTLVGLTFGSAEDSNPQSEGAAKGGDSARHEGGDSARHASRRATSTPGKGLELAANQGPLV